MRQSMEVIDLNFNVTEAFGNLHRERCVLIAAVDDQDRVLTGAKPEFFPPGITRLLGGGVDKGEDVTLAAARELEEELGVSEKPEKFVPLAQFNTHAEDASSQGYYNETYLYGVSIGDTAYRPGDDVKKIVGLKERELRTLGRAFLELPQSLWYRGKEGDFSWHDYGKLYGVIHHFAANSIYRIQQERKKSSTF